MTAYTLGCEIKVSDPVEEAPALPAPATDAPEHSNM
jgi:hypothetical protein